MSKKYRSEENVKMKAKYQFRSWRKKAKESVSACGKERQRQRGGRGAKRRSKSCVSWRGSKTRSIAYGGKQRHGGIGISAAIEKYRSVGVAPASGKSALGNDKKRNMKIFIEMANEKRK
jgi:hypothetical protein